MKIFISNPKDKIKAKCLIIIPIYNEQDSIGDVLKEVTEKNTEYDYLVIDDCSTDSSKIRLNSDNYSYISLPINLGIGGAVQEGYKYALENNYDIAIQIDGDGQHDVAYLEDIIKSIVNDEVDIVIGSRFINGKGFQSTALRRIGISFLSSWIYILCGQKIKDVTSGFRAVNRKFLEIFANDYPEDYPEPEAIVTALCLGGRIKEVPVVMRERTAGKSSINFTRSMYYMIKVTLAILFSRISHHKKI